MSTLDSINAGPSEAVSELTRVGLLVIPAAPVTTLIDSTPVAKRDVDIAVTAASGANFAPDDFIAIGGFDPNEIDIAQVEAEAPTDTLVLKSGTQFAHPVGRVVQVLEELILGEVEESGIEDGLTLGIPVKHVGTRHGPWVNNPGFHDNEVAFQILNASLETWKQSFALQDAAGGGVGTIADPFFLDINMEEIVRDAVTNPAFINGRIPCVFMEGEFVHSGDQFRVEFWSCSLAEGDRTSQLVVGDNTMVQFRFNWFANKRIKRFPLS